MMTRTAQCVLLVSLSFSVFAKAPNPLCSGDVVSDFLTGDGSKTNPYLVCTNLQLQRLAQELPLLEKHYRLGTDLDYQNFPFRIIGSATTPFTGTFDGNGYTISSISLLTANTTHVAPFAYVKNGKIENLTINGMSQVTNISNIAGGLVGRAENSSLVNIHITGINMDAPNHSGGLVGELEGGFVINCSTEGTMSQHFGTDGSGGIVGNAKDADISSCSSNVKQVMVSNLPFGASAIGGVAGTLVGSRVSNVYSQGDIDYGALDASGVAGVGGLVGAMNSSLLTNAYYAGKIVVQGAQDKGGAVGAIAGSITENVFWDRQVSGVTQSAAGESKTTKTLKKKTFWTALGFDEHLWRLIGGNYPALFGADGV